MQGVWFKDENKETVIINETLDEKAYREHCEFVKKNRGWQKQLFHLQLYRLMI